MQCRVKGGAFTGTMNIGNFLLKLAEALQDDQTPGVALISVKPKLEKKTILQEWPVLIEDLIETFHERNNPSLIRNKSYG